MEGRKDAGLGSSFQRLESEQTPARLDLGSSTSGGGTRGAFDAKGAAAETATCLVNQARQQQTTAFATHSA